MGINMNKMKYRVKDNSRSEAVAVLLFWWILFPFGYDSNPFSIQYKKHWWNRWKDYKENNVTKSFKTYEDAKQYINNLEKN